MSLTFEEAAERLRLAIPENFVSPTMHAIAVMAETQYRVIYELRNTYAPIVEMTVKENSYFMDALHGDALTLVELLDRLPRLRKAGMFLKFSVEDLARVWLHSEAIKVIDNEKS